MTQSDKTDTKKEGLILALTKSLGVVSTACKKAGVSRDSHYRWMKTDPDYKRKVVELRNVALDFAETHLFQLIREGNPAATIFFLKTIGKGRGYIETQDLQVTEKKPLTWMNEVTKKQKLGKN